jgi:hypothetical protein
MFNAVKDKAMQFASENATVLLTAGGVVGTVATGILAGRAGFKTGEKSMQMKVDRIAEELDELNETNPYVAAKVTEIPKKDLIKATVMEWIPPVLVGSATVGAIVFSHRMSAQKAAALAAAYGLAERNLSEYKAKVQEKLTGPKTSAIDDELAQDAVNRTPGHDNIVIVDGEILCYDKSGGRYFRSTVEAIKQAVNTINAEIIAHGFATATSFYSEINLPANAWSDEVGFDMSNMVELTYSTAMVGGNRTCFVFEFKSLPRTEFGPKYTD